MVGKQHSEIPLSSSHERQDLGEWWLLGVMMTRHWGW